MNLPFGKKANICLPFFQPKPLHFNQNNCIISAYIIRKITMKKLLIAIAVFGLMGCCDTNSNETSPTSIVPEKIVMEYGVDLNDYPNAKTDFILENDYQYDAVEKYGSIAFKAIDACFTKNENMLDGIDTSTDYGDLVLSEFITTNSKCVDETLSTHKPIPENMRKQIPRDENVGLELNESEIDSYEDVMPTAPYDKTSKHYKEVRKICEHNNEFAEDFENAVEFCVSKGM